MNEQIINGRDYEGRRSKPAAAIHTLRRDFGAIFLDDVEIDAEPEWLVKGTISLSGLSAIWGEPGSGKSFLALDMAMAIAQGSPFFDNVTIPGGVAYIAAEGGRGVKKRLCAYRQRHGLPRGLPFALVPTAVDLCTEEGHETEALIAELQRIGLLMSEPLRLVVIDTLNRVLAGGNENDSQDMGRLIRNCDRIREITKAHVLLVHHGAKDATKKTRGHSSLFGALDTAIEVTVNETSGLRTAKIRKQKDGEDGTTFTFKLDVERIEVPGQEPVTSCVVRPEEPDDAQEAPTVRKLSGANAIALEALKKAVSDHGQQPPANNHIPPHTPAVSPTLWRQYFYQMRSTDSSDANQKAFKRAVIQLQNRNLAATWGEFSWVIQ